MIPGRRRSAAKRSHFGRALAVVVVILVSVVGGWSAYAMVTGGGAQRDAASRGAGTHGEASPGGEGQTSRATVAACAAELSTAEKVASAAREGVSHWSRHIQARTDMIEGRISEERMRDLWKRTRLAGPADQRRFQAALQQYDGMSQCEALRTVPDSLAEIAARCETRSERAAQAVSAGRAAMADWKSHLDNMAAFANGQMTSAAAQHHWVAAWRAAPANIAAYQDARERLSKAPRCTSPAA